MGRDLKEWQRIEGGGEPSSGTEEQRRCLSAILVS